jgi:hypothetical protein
MRDYNIRGYDQHYEKSTPQALEQVAGRLGCAQQQDQLQPSYQSQYPHSPMDLGGGYFDSNPSYFDSDENPDYFDSDEIPNATDGNTAIDVRDKAQQKVRYTFYNKLPSLLFMQFMSQAARERERLQRQRGLLHQGRRQTLPWYETLGPQGSAENNVRRFWMNQGVWAAEWGPAWPEDADVLFSWDYEISYQKRGSGRLRRGRKRVKGRIKRGLRRVRGRLKPGHRRGKGAGSQSRKAEIPGHPFMDIRWAVDVFKPFPYSWGHEEPDDAMTSQISFKSSRMIPLDLGPPEKLIPQVPQPGASTPAAHSRAKSPGSATGSRTRRTSQEFAARPAPSRVQALLTSTRWGEKASGRTGSWMASGSPRGMTTIWPSPPALPRYSFRSRSQRTRVCPGRKKCRSPEASKRAGASISG